MYSIKQLATLAHCSIRTLHYYDEIGLLKPLLIHENGYRYYGLKELLRLQQILFYKELDFSLGDIKRIMNSPDFSIVKSLEDHKKLLGIKKQRLKKLLSTIDTTIKQLKGDELMNDDFYNGFDEEELEKYKEEAKGKWGHTRTYQQSLERTKHWTKKNYLRIKQEGEEITKKIAEAMPKGEKSPEVQQLIGKHYQHVSQFYEVSWDMYKSLGKMYGEDSRFTAYYERFAKGLAHFMYKAMEYFADSQEHKCERKSQLTHFGKSQLSQ